MKISIHYLYELEPLLIDTLHTALLRDDIIYGQLTSSQQQFACFMIVQSLHEALTCNDDDDDDDITALFEVLHTPSFIPATHKQKLVANHQLNTDISDIIEDPFANLVLSSDVVLRRCNIIRGSLFSTFRTRISEAPEEIVNLLDAATAALAKTSHHLSEEYLHHHQVHHRAVFHSLPDLIFVFDQSGLCQDQYTGESNLVTLAPEACLNHPIEDILLPEVATIVQEVFAEALQTTSVQTREYTTSHTQQRHHCIEVRAASNGDHVIVIIRDISERKLVEQELQKAYHQLQIQVRELERHNRDITLLNEMGDYLQSSLKIDDAYKVIAQFANRLFGGESGALYILTPSHNIVESVATWGNPPMKELVFSSRSCWALRRGRIHREECPQQGHYCMEVDDTLPYPYMCIPLIAQGKTFGLLRLRNSTIDSKLSNEKWSQLATMVAEHIALALANLQLREQLRDQSIHDIQTGMFNRRYLEETLERELRNAQYQHYHVGIVMIDIDHFKRVNDMYGYSMGDVTLRAVGLFLQQHTTGREFACRYSGEEFVLILPNVSLDDTMQRAMLLCTQITSLEIHGHGDTLVPLTFSIGVACHPHHGETSDAILQAANGAMLQAKREGRDRVVVASQDG